MIRKETMFDFWKFKIAGILFIILGPIVGWYFFEKSFWAICIGYMLLLVLGMLAVTGYMSIVLLLKYIKKEKERYNKLKEAK